jgi:hypothetical protein
LSSIIFAELCVDECESYVALLDANIPIPDVLNNLEGIVKYLRINSALPLLLAGYRCLEQTEFKKLIFLILKTYLRFVLITNQNPLDLETVYYNAARALRSAKDSNETSRKTYQIVKSVLAKLVVSDENIKEHIFELNLERSDAVWLMTQIAEKLQSGTDEIGMNKANLEHIFPQNPSAAWNNKSDLEPYTWNIGNLTILGDRLNKDAKNKGFIEKASTIYNRSEIQMTKDLLAYTEWSVDTIKDRANKLSDKIIEIWPASL